MKTFKDNCGREWSVEINVSAIKRVRSMLAVDLLNVLEGTLIQDLVTNPILLVDVLYVVCKPQADAKGVTDEQFGEGMAGDAIESATKALLDELVSFSPSPKDRANLGRVLQATQTAMDRARDLVSNRLNSGELDRVADEAIRQTLGGSSGSAPESSASIQGA